MDLYKECIEFLQGCNITDPIILEKAQKIIPTIAARKCLGVKNKDENAKECLYCWEVENFTMVEVASLKELKNRREQRKLYGQKVQKIWKLISTIKDVNSYVYDYKI